MIWLAWLVMMAAAWAGHHAPAQAFPASELRFDVASIRLADPGAVNGMIKPLAGGHGYEAHNIPVKLMMSLMYKVPMRQISGEPEWMANERYDIEARADGQYGIDDLQAMFRNLLADRFGLKFHIDVREGNVYALTVDPAGSKLTVNEAGQDFKIPVSVDGDGAFVGRRVPMRYFCWWLGQQLQNDRRPVVNLTGMSGNYDWRLLFAPVLPPDVPRESLPPEVLERPSLFDALKEQAGMKLTAQRGPVEHYVVEKVERPSAN